MFGQKARRIRELRGEIQKRRRLYQKGRDVMQQRLAEMGHALRALEQENAQLRSNIQAVTQAAAMYERDSVVLEGENEVLGTKVTCYAFIERLIMESAKEREVKSHADGHICEGELPGAAVCTADEGDAAGADGAEALPGSAQ